MAESSAKAWQDFAASAALLERDNEAIHSRYRNKWIGVYRGHIEASCDTFDEVIETLSAKNISTADSLIKFIGQKEMTLIL